MSCSEEMFRLLRIEAGFGPQTAKLVCEMFERQDEFLKPSEYRKLKQLSAAKPGDELRSYQTYITCNADVFTRLAVRVREKYGTDENLEVRTRQQRELRLRHPQGRIRESVRSA